jgi:phosphoribosylamine--glycine ligase
MNIALLSSSACFHQVAQLLEKESTDVYHYGASRSIQSYGRYTPVHDWLSDGYIDTQLTNFLNVSKDKHIDYVMASGLSASKNTIIHAELKARNIPYLFVSSAVAEIERDKSITKQMLNKLGIPTPKFQKADGAYLYENFKTIPRPFVVKLNSVYQHGKQTIVVKDENHREVFEDLFSLYTTGDPKITNIDKKTSLLIEEYIELKQEYSYHALFNKSNWQYLGTARDYKKLNDGDTGPNTVSLGCYSVLNVDSRIHEYAEKIYNFLKIYLGNQQLDHYRGFIFLGIGINQDGVPMILEINTRGGDPELPAILGTVENNISDLLYTTSADLPIPQVKHNGKETVSIRVINRVYDWTTPASFLPKFENIPNDILAGFDGGPIDHSGQESKLIKHSIFTTTRGSREEAATRIYNYLDTQHIGQYTYRRDIGFLK